MYQFVHVQLLAWIESAIPNFPWKSDITGKIPIKYTQFILNISQFAHLYCAHRKYVNLTDTRLFWIIPKRDELIHRNTFC